MSFATDPDARPAGFLRRHRRVLLAGIVSFAVVGTAAGEFAMSARSLAAPVPTASQAFQTPPSFANVIEQVTPAVVSVKVQARQPVQGAAFDGDGSQQQPFQRFLRQFGGGDRRMPQQMVRAEGSGFFVTDDGYIVTNNHVVKDATQVDIVTSDGRTLHARIVGTDPQSDLALLKVDGKDFRYVRFAQQAPRVGDWVIAMGNPFGLGETATAGIVSANGRDIGEGPYDNFLQIDAPVNHGNSGGPTFNAAGEVVGVNTAIYSPNGGGSVGIGFAIPADTVQSVFTALKDKGVVTRGAIGVRIQPVTQGIADAVGLKDTHGALVDEATADGPAAKAGIASGDVITAVDGRAIADAHDLARRISVMAPGTKVSVSFMHKGEAKTADVALDQLPGTHAAQAETGGAGAAGDLPKLGLSLVPASEAPNGGGTAGVVVAEVDPSGIGAEHGIKAGDVIIGVNGQTVSTPADVRDGLRAARADHKKMALLRVQSGDQIRFVAVPVA